MAVIQVQGRTHLLRLELEVRAAGDTRGADQLQADIERLERINKFKAGGRP
jgi:hypothetical protein